MFVRRRIGGERNYRSKHGLYRSLINNMVEGGMVKDYNVKHLEMVGVGYQSRCATGQQLRLSSRILAQRIVSRLPKEVTVTADYKKEVKNPTISRLESRMTSSLVGAVAAKIRSYEETRALQRKRVSDSWVKK